MHRPYKQVLVVRKDLKMRQGKAGCQMSHASKEFLRRNIINGVPLSVVEYAWLASDDHTTIALSVESEEELLAIHEYAVEMGVKSYLVHDLGFTEFHGQRTLTCLALGPDENEKLDAITGKQGRFPLRVL